MKLCIVLDTSGSMAEGGKFLIALTALKTIEQYFWINQVDIEVDLFAVNDGVEQVSWEDFRQVCKGLRGSFCLKPFLQSGAHKSANKLLIISDCCWSSDNRRAFKSLTVSKGKMFARGLIVGSEADLSCRAPDFESAENVLALLESWLH